VEFCITQALMIISGLGRSSCAMTLFFSSMGLSSPGLALENTSRSVPTGAIPPGDGGVPGLVVDVAAELLPEAVVPPAVAALVDAAAAGVPHALLLLVVRPAYTQGVVSELISILLPGGWLIAIVVVELEPGAVVVLPAVVVLGDEVAAGEVAPVDVGVAAPDVPPDVVLPPVVAVPLPDAVLPDPALPLVVVELPLLDEVVSAPNAVATALALTCAV
jgi:hypothetical protein